MVKHSQYSSNLRVMMELQEAQVQVELQVQAEQVVLQELQVPQ